MAQQSQVGKIVLVAVLAVVLGIVLLAQFGVLPLGFGKRGGSAAPIPTTKTGVAPAPVPATNEPTPKALTKWKRPDPVGPLLRDPTRMDAPREAIRPGEASDAAPPPPLEPEYAVAGILFNAERPSSVIIDGHILHEGDTIHDAVIDKIAEGSVELSREGKKWIVKPGEHYRGSEVVRPHN